MSECIMEALSNSVLLEHIVQRIGVRGVAD